MEFFNVSVSYYQITESWIILKMSWAALVFLATHWHQSEPKPTFWTASSSPFLLQFLWFRPASKATLQLRPHFLYCSPSISAENSHLKRVKKLHGVRRVVCSSLPTLCGSLCGNKHMKKKATLFIWKITWSFSEGQTSTQKPWNPVSHFNPQLRKLTQWWNPQRMVI